MLLPTLRFKLIGGLLWALLAGPKILLLFPCWLLGCLAYHVSKSFRINTSYLYFCIIQRIFLVTTMIERWHHWSPWGYEGLGTPPLFYSAKYLDDYTIAGG